MRDPVSKTKVDDPPEEHQRLTWASAYMDTHAHTQRRNTISLSISVDFTYSLQLGRKKLGLVFFPV